jgi:hypothetical protein
MRRFFTISFIILALVISAAGSAPVVHAQTTTQDEADAIAQAEAAATTAANATAAADAAKRTPTPDETRTESASWGFGWIMAKIMSLFAWLVGVAALMLNYAMYYTVVDMGGYVKHLTAIGTVWGILRDIGNLLLIFGFLAVGISIILDSEWYGGGKKLLPTLLIVAVFANFSLFAAEAVIDVGNLFATQIYKQINAGELPNPSDPDQFSKIIQNKGIAGVLMTRLGLPSIYGGTKEISTNGLPVFAGDSPWYMSFMSIIVFIVVAFVMFALAFVLISRFVVLILLIMVSPIGFAGYAVPGLQSWAKKWWDTLFQQTITAPILLLLLYIALSVIVDDGFLGFGANTRPAWTGIQTGNFIGFAGILLSYLIAVGLLLAVVYFAKTLSAVGAGWATKTAGALTIGATAFAGRRTVGRLSNYTARKIRSSSLGRSETGRLLAGVADRGAKASFDVRGTSALKNIPGGGIDAGAAQKGGYKGIEDKAIKAREDYAKSLKGRNKTSTETMQINVAEDNRKKAEELHKGISDERKLTETETIKLRAEVKRLENLSIKSPETDRALGAAQQKLATSETNLATASTKLTQAAEKLADYKEEEAKIKAKVGIDTSTKVAQQAYGEALQKKTIMGITRAPYDWTTVAGSARRDAADKIKTSKPTKDQLAELLKKMQKEEEEEAGKGDKDKDKSEDKKDTKEEKAK